MLSPSNTIKFASLCICEVKVLIREFITKFEHGSPLVLCYHSTPVNHVSTLFWWRWICVDIGDATIRFDDIRWDMMECIRTVLWLWEPFIAIVYCTLLIGKIIVYFL